MQGNVVTDFGIDFTHYQHVNESYSRPFVFGLTGRGFYSEINVLLNAVLYGLINRRRLIVDQSKFLGMEWLDFFSTGLPRAAYDPSAIEEGWVIQGVASPHFHTVRNFVIKAAAKGEELTLPDLGLRGSVFDIKRALTHTICVPSGFASVAEARSHYVANTQLANKRFAAFHIRRDDKVIGYEGRKGNWVIEGEDIAIPDYIQKLKTINDGISLLYLMTDDSTIVGDAEIEAEKHGMSVIHTCDEAMTGYANKGFKRLPVAEKTRQIQDLISQTWTAAGSDVFLGGFKSNVARFLPLIHLRPEQCFSVDARQDWDPS